MALGRVVVASDVGGHKELIQDGETGFLFPAGNAQALADRLQQVIAQRSGWDAVRLRGRRFVEEERSWQRSVAAYDALYERVCRGRTPSKTAVPAFDDAAESLLR